MVSPVVFAFARANSLPIIASEDLRGSSSRGGGAHERPHSCWTCHSERSQGQICVILALHMVHKLSSLRPSCSRIRGHNFATLKFWLIGMVKAAPLDRL